MRRAHNSVIEDWGTDAVTLNHMRRLLKYILGIVLILVLIPIGWLFLPAAVWQWGITTYVEQGLGGRISWHQPLEYDGGLRPHWRINGVEVTPFADNETSIVLPDLQLRLDLTTLTERMVTVDEFHVVDADVLIKKSSTPSNTTQPAGKKVLTPDERKLFFNVNRIQFENSRFRYNDLKPVIVHAATMEKVEGERNQIEVNAEYGEYSGNLNGLIPNAVSLLSGTMQPVEFSWDGVGLVGTLEGQVSLSEMDIGLDIDIRSLDALAPLVGYALPDLHNIGVNGRFSGSYQSLRVSDINLICPDERLNLVASGEINNITTLEGIKTDIVMNSVHVNPLLALYGRDFPVDATIVGEASLNGSKEKLAMQLRDVVITGGGLDARINGATDDLAAGNSGRFEVDASLEDLGALLNHFVKRKWERFGTITAKADITAEGGLWRAQISEAELNGAGRHATASGSIGDLRNLKQVDIKAEARIDSLTSLDPIPRVRLMDFGPISATARLVDGEDGSLFKLTDMVGRHETEESRADVTGVIGNLTRFDKVDISMSAWVSGLNVLKPFTRYELPALGALRADGRLIRDGGPIHIDIPKANLEGSGVTASAVGRVYDTGVDRRWVYEADVEADVDSLKRVEVFFPQRFALDLPPLGALYANANVIGDSKKELDITGTGYWGEDPARRLNATVQYNNVVRAERELQGTFEGTIPSLSQVFSKTNQRRDELVGTIGANGQYHYQHGVLALRQTELLAADGELTGQVRGDFKDVLHFEGLDGVVDLTANEALTSELLETFGLKYLDDGGDSQVRGELVSSGKIQQLNNFSLRTGENQATGNIKVDWTEVPSIEGEITVEKFKLRDIREDIAKGDDSPDPNRMIIPDVALPLESFKKVNAKLKANLVEFNAGLLNFGNTSWSIDGENGRWSLEGVTLKDQGVVNFLFDASGPQFRVSNRINSIGLKAGTLMKRPGETENESSIPLQIDWNLISSGNTSKELMSNLYGYARLRGDDIYIGSRMLNLLAGDVTTEFLGLLNRSEENVIRKETVYCIGANTQIENGVIDFGNNLGILTDALIISGAGTIDLNSEHYNIAITPTPRKGLGISAASVVRHFGLRGTFANPTISQSTGDALRNILLGTTAFITGGTSVLIMGALSRLGSDSDICVHAYTGDLGRSIEESANDDFQPGDNH